VAAIFRNTGHGFTNSGLVFPAVGGFHQSSAVWGDYDNDGRLDILFPAVDDGSSTGLGQVWRNTGTGFSNTFSFPITSFDGVAAWGDYDNDGLLDILFVGRYTFATNTTTIF
jgi:hypothetical protein